MTTLSLPSIPFLPKSKSAKAEAKPIYETVIVVDAVGTWVAMCQPSELVQYARRARYTTRNLQMMALFIVGGGALAFVPAFLYGLFAFPYVQAVGGALWAGLIGGGIGFAISRPRAYMGRWYFWREPIYEQVPILDDGGNVVANDDGEQLFEQGAAIGYTLIPITPESIIRDAEATKGQRADIVEGEREQRAFKAQLSNTSSRMKRIQQISIVALVAVMIFGAIITWSVTSDPPQAAQQQGQTR